MLRYVRAKARDSKPQKIELGDDGALTGMRNLARKIVRHALNGGMSIMSRRLRSKNLSRFDYMR
jgi:hypothetical protein